MGSGGSYSVLGTHTYPEGGSFAVTTTLTNGAGQTTVVATPATISDPAISVTGQNFTAQQLATTNNYTVATISDAGPSGGASDYTAVVDWGDKSSDAFTDTSVVLVNGVLTLLGTHQYTDQGTFTVTTTITDAGGATATTTCTATVTPAALTATPTTINAAEGTAANNLTVATFSGTAGGYAATIDWGDGSATTSGTISGTAVKGSHTYAEAGTYNVSVTLTDSANNTAVATSTATVADGALSQTTAPLSGVQGQAVSGVAATFTDANPNGTLGDFTATIDWGDGTQAAGTITQTGNSFTVSGSNTYFEAGSYAVQVTVTDQDGATVTATATATIADASLTVSVASLTPTSGAALSGVTVATFTDAYQHGLAADYSATINWGDGTAPTQGTVSGAGGTYSVSGNHTYPAGATTTNYTVAVVVTDPGGSQSGSASATVYSTPVYEVATFTDSNPNDTSASFTAMITWGDGTAPTPGQITGGSGTFAISAAHAFPEPGSVNITES
jgi:hypothetical protein